MRNPITSALAASIAAGTIYAPRALAQNFNIDVGTAFGTPLNTYGGAAGQPGTWNNPLIGGSSAPVGLFNISGAVATGVGFMNVNANTFFSFNNLATTLDDQRLLDDTVDLTDPGPGQFLIYGLIPCTYDVYTYAWAPDDPIGSTTSVSVNGEPAQIVGGQAWTSHAPGLTYAKHTVAVGAGQSITVDAETISGMGRVNGFQLRMVTPSRPPWVRQFGTTSGEDARGAAPDGAGGVYVVGWTHGDLLTGASLIMWNDPFVARYDSTGARLWVRQFGTKSTEETALAAAPDGAGGVYISGEGYSTPGGGTGSNILVARYDGAGTRLWTDEFGTTVYDLAQAAAADGAGGVYAAGWTEGVLTGPASFGGRDAWVTRYTGAGARLWVRQFGTGGFEHAHTAAPDGAGGVYVGGTTSGGLGGPSAGLTDGFLVRYSSAGAQLWARQLGTGSDDVLKAAAADGAGGVYVTGETSGSLGGPNAGSQDAWLARYNSAGTQLWIRQFGTNSWDLASAAATDGSGGVYVGGTTAGSLGAPSAGFADAFLAHYSGAGTQVGVSQFWPSNAEFAWAAASDGMHGVYLVGSTQGSLAGPYLGNDDIFVARFGCYPDCNNDGAVNVADFGCFQTRYVLHVPYADCTQDCQLTVADFGCFQTAFVAGCP